MRNNSSRVKRGLPAVKSISRATCVISCLGEGINTLTDIADYCKLSKSTVHRLLRALEQSHLATQDPVKHKYYLGPLISRLTSNPQTTHEYLIMCAVGEMGRLSGLVEETVNLAVMIALQDVPLYEIPSKHDLRVTEESKRLGPLYAGATVKALLSQLSDEELKIAMLHIDITAVTEKTVTDKNVLMAQLKETRQRGYAVTCGEKIPGAMEMAVPIRNYIFPAALSVLAPESRIKSRTGEILEELQKSALSISDNIADIFKT